MLLSGTVESALRARVGLSVPPQQANFLQVDQQ
jgi:hypothetical protein